jgi:TonB-linked SusC/RagA family outer membrane protein
MHMMNKVYFTFLCLLLSAGGSWAQELALREKHSSNYGQKLNNSKSLKTVIKELEVLYDVSIVCDSELIETTVFPEKNNTAQSLEGQLDHLLAKSNLTYDKISKNFYVIVDRKETPKKKPINTTKSPANNLTPSIIEMSQDITITGKVTSSNGESLPGVNVLIEGTSTGTVTDLEGQYTLSVPNPNAVIIFSFIGYATQKVATNGRTVIDVVLEDESEALEEVVVTAMGIQRQAKSLTYSAQVVDGSSVSEARETNLINSLQGKVAGVTITRSATGPGGSSKVLIRGSRSITGGNQPLYVIDGVPLNNSTRASGGGSFGGRDGGGGIGMLNPDNIESMTVLKGASAAAIYGSAGQNGAIVITTKGGKEGEIVVDYNGGITFDQAFDLPERQYEYGQGDGGVYSPSSERSFGPKANGQDVTLWNGKTVPLTGQPNNVEDFFRTGTTLMNSISASGGNEKMLTYFSYGNAKAEGILRNHDLTRHNFDLKVDNKITSKLSFTTKLTYIMEDVDNKPHTGEQGYAISSIYRSPTSIPLSEMQDFAYIDDQGIERQNYWKPGSSILSNPYWNLNRDLFYEHKDRLIGLLNVRYEFADWINLQVRGSIDKTMEKTERKVYNDTYTTYGLGSIYDVGDYVRQNTNVDALLSINRDLSESFNLSLILGGALQQGRSTSVLVESNGLNKQNHFFLTNAKAPLTSNGISLSPQVQSLFGTATVSYKDYLFLEATGRNDWSSALPKDNQSYFYPSVGLTGVVTEMLSLPSWVTFGKLRASLAYSGSGGSAYRDRNYYSVGRGGLISTPTVRSLPTYKPEMTSAFEIGADWRFFAARLGIDFTYYYTDTKNQLITIATPAASLFSSQYINAGLINNNGIEVSMNVVPVEKEDFVWDATFNFAKNNNKIIRLTDEVTSAVLTDDRQVLVLAEVGGSYGDMYAVGWQRDDLGRPLVNAEGSPMLTPGKTVDVGNYNPDFNLGFNNNINYKDLSLGFLIDYRHGGTVIAGTQALLDADGHSKASLWGREEGIVLDAYTVEGEKNTKSITSQSYFGTIGERYPAGEFYAYSGNNLRLREVVLGYNFANDWVRKSGFINSAKISLIGRNLLFFYKEAPFDPELVAGTGNAGGIEYNSLPTTRSMGVNLKLTF